MPIKRYDPRSGESRHVDDARAGFPFLTALACVLCVVMTGGYWLTDRNGPMWGAFPAEAIWDGRWGALVTTTLVHGDLIHLFFNVSMLWRFGEAVERALGHLEWAGFCLLAAAAASGTELALFGDTGIGASGVVYALFGIAWGARRSVRSFGLVASNDTVRFLLAWIVLTFVLTEMGLMRIANGAHVGGLVFGFATAWLLLEKGLPPARRVGAAVALALLVALTLASVTWQPWSLRWQLWRQTAPNASLGTGPHLAGRAVAHEAGVPSASANTRL